MLDLRSRFLRYSFAYIFLAIRASRAVRCGNRRFNTRPQLRAMSCQLQFADWVPFCLPQVFAFFSNPENLPRLMPPETQTRIDRLALIQLPPASRENLGAGQAAGVGSIIATSFRPFRVLPWRREWIAAVTEFEWDHRFADVQQKGPFKQWHHRHEFLAESRNGVEGTLVGNLIEYEVGCGALGVVANSLFIAGRCVTSSPSGRRSFLSFLPDSNTAPSRPRFQPGWCESVQLQPKPSTPRRSRPSILEYQRLLRWARGRQPRFARLTAGRACIPRARP
jgi:ligand-binding SRPBCC domain-containing protein